MRSRALLGLLVVLCFALGMSVPHASAQAVFGSVLGTVTDPQGNAVAGAKVVVTSTTKNFTFETTSNESGNYSVTHLIPDTYKIRVEATGFKAYDVPSVVVQADSSAKVDASLQVGDVATSVEVTGEIPQLKTDRADVDIEFNQTYVSELPVLNRNFTNFELLTPGTQKLVGWSHAATENPQGGGQIFVNGQHFSGTNFELDGTDNQDPILGIIVVNPNLDAIGEAKIALQDYDAEAGKAIAGNVKVQTKSGTNDFHGGGFYYYRNSDQQARDPFVDPPGKSLAAATWKQFGGNIGGPIVKNKLFFFGDYQGTKQQQGISNLYTIPTLAVEKSCNPATNAASATPGFCDLSQYVSANGQAYDPTTGSMLDGSGRSAFAGNLIPIGRISPAAAAILAKFPAPNKGAASDVRDNFVAQGAGPYDQKSFDVRIDYAAPRNYQVFGRFSLDYFSLSGKGGLGALGGAGFGPGGLSGSSINHDYSLATGFTKPIGSKWLTDVRFGYFKYNPVTAYSDSSAKPMDAFGIPCLNSTSTAPGTDCASGIAGAPTTGGLSSFFFNNNGSQGAFSSITAFGDGLNVGRCNCPLTESEQQFQVVNNWTLTQGNHSIKFGADIRYAMNLRVPSDSNRTGILNFDAGGTSLSGSGGNALATFLLGDVTSFQRFVSTSTNAAERQKRLFFYAQDSWRVTPKFTFTYGLRWEMYFPENVNAKGNGGFADQQLGVVKVAGYGPIGLDGNVKNTYKAVAPRMSFAYQFDPKTVVRIGYGRSFDIGVFGSNFGHVVTQNLPVLAQQSLADATCFPVGPAPTSTPGPCIANSGAHSDRSAVFTLGCGPITPAAYCSGLTLGPEAFDFGPILGAISSGGTLPLLGPKGDTSPNIRPGIQRLPTIDQWNATIQRQVTPTLSLTASYVGNKGTHVFAGRGPSYNSNEPAIGGGTDKYTCTPNGDGTFDCVAAFQAFEPANNRRRLFLNGVAALPFGCCATDLNYNGNDANDNYEALQVKAEKRVSAGLQFIAHYTFSHAYSYDGGYYSVDKKFAYGPNPDNRNHEFVINSVYELPIGRGKKFMSSTSRAADLLIGGWQVTNTLTWGGGLPWTPSLQNCGEVSDAGPCRPNILPGAGKLRTGVSKGIDGNLYWFQPLPTLDQAPEIKNSPTNITGTDACTTARPANGPFVLPACGQIGNLGIYSYRGPHAFFDDMALSKNFTITERIKAQFRFDAYNVFNHPVLGFNSNQGSTCIDCSLSSGAGRITDIENDSSPGSPTGMRQLQFGFRVTF